MTATQRRSSGHSIASFGTRKGATALLLAGSLLALAGCSDSGTDASPSTPSPTQTAGSSSPGPTADAEDAAVIAAYTSSWDAQTEAYKKAASAGTDLKKSTTLQALADIEKDLAAMRRAGQVTTGKPVIHPKVVKVTDAEISKATVADCVDTTNWLLIDKTSKKEVPLPSERLTKYVSTATLEKWGTKWMVTKLTAQDQAC
ncbi:hypothetical protein [Streptomyces lunaelactis]|uniref:hypothetical protein n=1 Tax=Streptomyces lunaelactis TaxID=1535768 RepID=UPI001585B9F4|nr:hypothetical protein [Streptomyces lunaelactis]NUK21682.1 hypothetical protein [Streptomyces lunaelactis]